MKNIDKLFKNTCFLLSAAFFFNCLSADALQIFYPKTPNTETSAASTFFVGNTTPGSKLTINGKEVKVYENGSFVEVVPLKDGFNQIKIDSQNNVEHDIFTYVVKKVPKENLMVKEPQTEVFPENQYIYATIVKNNTPLRAQPDEYAKRITHLDNNTALLLNGKKGGYYRVSLSPSENAWVKAENIVTYSTVNGKLLAQATGVKLDEDGLFNYIKTDLTYQVPYKITETENGLRLDLYNISKNPADTMMFKTSGNLKSLAINTIESDNLSTYFIETQDKLWGYNAYYEGNTLVLKIRKTPQINLKEPLNGIKVTIDAGHGGDCDDGAIGPTGVKEKDINLDIAKKLQQVLIEQGADVVMTRTDDTAVDLYKRVKIAKDSDSLFLISIHSNALEDGKNPYLKHGSASYFYNREAVELAKTLRDSMVKELNTMDDGVCMKSLALTRPTMPLSVLVEVAYMINPEDYQLLLQEGFRQKAAVALKNGLETYLLNSVNSSAGINH